MGENPAHKRDYKHEASLEDEKRKEDRRLRMRARRAMEKEGLVEKNDNKDIDHKKPLRDGGSNDRSNLRVVDEGPNRAWRKGKKGYD